MHKLKQRNWDSVRALAPNNHDMTLEFHRILDELMNECYEWKKVRRRTSDKPWLSDGLRKSIKKRAAIFRENGRCLRWKRIDKAIKKTLAFRKAEYNKRQKERLEKSGRTGQWWNISKFLLSDENPRQWAITDLDPEKTARELADDLSSHFTAVTNMASPLLVGQIPQSNCGQGLVRLLEEKQVAKRLQKFKKPNCRVEGDLPRAIVSQSADALSVPLTMIYNYSFINHSWPDPWKLETVVPIPKVPTTESMNDIRPISMTPLWSLSLIHI